MRTGLLLGAGFSYDLGMPLAAEVTKVFLELFNESNVPRIAAILSIKNPYGNDRPINKSAVHEVLTLVLNYKRKLGNDYEELLANLADLESLPQKTQSDRDSYHFLFNVFYDIIYKMLVTFQRESYNSLYERNKPWFAKLCNLLSTRETWIFSLNHDLYLECLAIDLGVPITYGDQGKLTFPVSNLELNRKVNLRYLRRDQLSLETPGWIKDRKGINLVRLHGGFSEFEYRDSTLICTPPLERSRSMELILDFETIESMGYYYLGRRIPSGKDRIITGLDGRLDIVTRALLMGGRKYTKTTNAKKGEEKLQIFEDVLTKLDELTIIGYSFGDLHVDNRISNAMVLNPGLKLRLVDPASRPWPDFLQQFDYDLRIRKAVCGAAQWMTYVGDEKWDQAQIKALKQSESVRAEIKRRVEMIMKRRVEAMFGNAVSV